MSTSTTTTDLEKGWEITIKWLIGGGQTENEATGTIEDIWEKQGKRSFMINTGGAGKPLVPEELVTSVEVHSRN